MEEKIYKKEFVEGLFNRMSKTYGIVNYLSSFGFTERWRRQCVDEINWGGPMIGCDLMSGMGETWGLIRAKGSFQIIGVDSSKEMVSKARKRLEANKDWKVVLLEEDVLVNSIESDKADFMISAFGLKTFSEPGLRMLAKEVKRILKVGGQFAFIEVSVPNCKILKVLFMFYLKNIIPIIGKVFLGNSTDYKMLGKYCERFINCMNFSAILKHEGLEVTYKKYFYGCASGVVGIKK